MEWPWSCFDVDLNVDFHNCVARPDKALIAIPMIWVARSFTRPHPLPQRGGTDPGSEPTAGAPVPDGEDPGSEPTDAGGGGRLVCGGRFVKIILQ